MNRLVAHLVGISLIPFVWLVILLGIVLLVIAGIVFTAALILVPGVVKLNGESLYRIIRKARK